MAQVEIYSLATPTNVRVGPDDSFTVARGDAALFNADSPSAPIIVSPTNPGGHVILLAPQELTSRSAEELAQGATRVHNGLVLSVRDVDSIDLNTVLPLARYAAHEGRTLVLRIGDA